MDSFSFPFERMSGLDMHPLSFPISRLSPAKSSSSIDQYTHHHGKGDSAYSSFSGGSNAPDLSSPFFPDDLHPPGFHYADFKYMNSALNFGGGSEPKSMDQLYRSMEALTRQCDQEDGDNCSNSNQQCSKKQTSPSASFPPLPSPPPPPPPARLESLVTVRNMENLRARQSPEGQTADRSRQRAHITLAPLPPPPPPPPLLFAGNPSSGPDTVYSLPVSQQNQAEPVNRDASAPPKSANALSRLAQMYPSAATEHDSQQGLVAQGNVLRKRAHSAHAALPPVPVHPADSGHQPPPLHPPSPNNGSIQHKGHFYFVTGVCRTEGSMPVADILENSSADVHKSLEKERVLEQEGGVQRAIHRCNSYDALSEREHFPRAQELSVRKQDADGYLLDNALLGRKQAPQISNIPEPGQRGREITGRHHSSSHPIFYCGPEESGPQVPPSSQLTSIPPPVADPSIHVEKQEEQVRKVRKQPLDGLPREKINKETTPLLYHLTGANQMAFMNKFKNDSDSRTGCRNPEWNSGALQHPEKELPNPKPKAVKGTNISSDQCEDSKIEMPLDTNLDSFSYPCNTLDDSYKKYYKEKLKDLQSRVLRETSFKRRDLQPHKIKQMLEQQPPVLQVFSSAQDPLRQADKLSNPWPQCQSQMSDPKSRNESLSERTREIETTRGESGQTVRKEKGRRASQENDLECVDIWGEDARKDIRVEETRKDVRGEEMRKSPKVAQPQVARIGGRKRLTQEQKKLCYSEPEKLHKLVDAPTHKPSHSLGNETEGLLTDDELGDQGLVAARKKLFEMRGRAMSASSLSKTTLKHLQHKALVAYMERKTGQKLTEPQQPCPQVPSQRHSAGGRTSDCDPRLHHGNGGLKKKVHRPLSAGRILDSSSSSIRYTQFGSTISGEHSRQSSWKGMPLVSSSKAASVESLLDQPELSGPYRARSKSTPYVLQVCFKTHKQ